jgi:hypothetical protein
MASSAALPQKSKRASSHATAMPSGVATSVAMAATRSESRIAVHSSGEIADTLMCDYEVGLIRKVKPYFSKIALAAAERRNAR